MPWLAIPFGDERAQTLKEAFRINGIPLLLILNRDGSLATGAGRTDVTNTGLEAMSKWLGLVK
jgi:nucleoredoxin